ncbi:MAG: DUF2147 domain-containing protein [Candidatus Hydrogenedentes bacterium]|nr:DUF2147 domain-containing protein [Candidatus Hydrogenedentota bacterium]
MKQLCVLAAMVILAMGAAYAETKEGDVAGTWYTEGGGSKVEIVKDGDTYNGKLTWLKEPNYGKDHAEAGKPKRDVENPEAAKQNDPIVGLKLLNGFKWDGAGAWSGGTIYNPEDGKTYKCVLKMPVDNNTLDVRGYVGIPALGQTQTWKRMTEEEKKKEAEAAAALPAPAPAAATNKKSGE